MVDVSDKEVTQREAIAQAIVTMKASTLAKIRGNALAKGDVLAVARVAGVMAAKRTADLVPLCHPLALNHVGIEFEFQDAPAQIRITTSVRCGGRTGVEMEALTAASVTGLTIYDMAKAIDRHMTLSEVKLLRKTGGKSGTWERS